MKRRFSTFMLFALLIIGAGLLSYPSVSNYWNSRTQSKMISDYESILDNVKEEDYENFFKQANNYNKQLNDLPFPLLEFDKLNGYNSLLTIGNNGMMGYITIDKINVKLPIYHGVSDAVLNVGIGHIPGTSLPTGEVNTHTVLSGHRGLPSAKLFTSLDKLATGDRFKLTVLNKLLTFEVDQIRIVLPDETDELQMISGKTYCTLLTCTPYGINTHRLLVRGVLVENDKPTLYVEPDAFQLDSLLLAPVIAMPILLVMLVVMLFKTRKRKK